MNTKKDIWTLSANYLSGEMNEAEKSKFEKMLSKDRKVEEEFKKIRIGWDKLESKKIPDSGLAWSKLLARLDDEGLVDQPLTVRFTAWNSIARIAAILIFTLMVGYSAYYVFSFDDRTISTMESFTASVSVSSFSLPDGSMVYLNKGSRIFYQADFNTLRKVILEGEGFFEVMKDSASPFRIETSSATITVLGTKFNVRENKSEESTEVYVESGSVRLSGEASREGIILEKGEFARASEESETRTNIDDLNFLAWKTREFSFTNQDLGSVINILRNSYHVDILVKDDEIYKLKLTSSYSQQSIDSILSTISLAFDLDYKMERGNFVLSLK